MSASGIDLLWPCKIERLESGGGRGGNTTGIAGRGDRHPYIQRKGHRNTEVKASRVGGWGLPGPAPTLVLHSCENVFLVLQASGL